jgi:tetratricopeptide (TPR) repeat protein
VKAPHRHRIAAAAFAAALLISGQGASAQAGVPQPPNPAAPRLLIWTFRSPDARLGFEFATALRDRVAKEINPKDLWVIPRQQVNSFLSTSGYRPDSALLLDDLKDLGKNLSAVETIDGVVTRTPEGIRFTPRFFYANNTDLVEIFPVVVQKDVEEAAQDFANQYKEMRKLLADAKRCRSALTAAKNDSAIAYGRAIIAAYPSSNIGRLCVLSGYSLKNYATTQPDSIIPVALEILAKDSTSRVALDNLTNAYFAKGDKEKSIEYAMRILAIDPSDAAVASGIVNSLFQAGAPERALPIINKVLAANPMDAEMLNKKLSLEFTLGKFKDAMATGELLAKVDPKLADVEFFKTMIAAAQKDSQPAKAIQFLGQATQKFPKDAELQFAYSTELRKAGQLQQAVDAGKRAIDANPKLTGGMVNVVVLYAMLNQPDSAFAFGKKALAAGADTATIADALLQTISPAMKKAQASESRADWEEAYRLASSVDSVAASKNTKFYAGVAAAQIGLKALQTLNDVAKADKAKACSDVKVIEDVFAAAMVNLGKGGSVDPAVAGNIMNLVNETLPKLPEFKKSVCGNERAGRSKR